MTMKILVLTSFLALFALSAQAQSVTIRIVSNDGSNSATNTVNLSSDKVAGLLSAWAKDSAAKGAAAISFNAFILQELSDKGAEWSLQAGRDAIKSAGVTNTIPDIAARRWFSLSSAQQTNAVNYLNAVQ